MDAKESYVCEMKHCECVSASMGVAINWISGSVLLESDESIRFTHAIKGIQVWLDDTSEEDAKLQNC